MNLTITYDADEDIRSIFDYTISEFGLNQAEKYYHGLQVKFSSILEGTAHIQDYSFVKEGLKRTNYQNHAIYHKTTKEQVSILRVLYQRMDQLKHFDT